VTGDNKSRPFGAGNPPLTATLSGFVGGQTLLTSGVTGQASCTTGAAPFSAPGTYPITCTLGTLASTDYSFGPLLAGALNVTTPASCVTGTQKGPVKIASGQTFCAAAGAKITGPIEMKAGGLLDLEGATVTGPLHISGAALVRVCGSTIAGDLEVSAAVGLVLIGGDAATGPCAGNTIMGPVTLKDNHGGVEFNGNHVMGPLKISGTTGTLPSPDAGSVHASGNTVGGPTKISP
jgi:hypothetical protein